jgi:fatty-acyl-CoA synthase
MSDMSLATITNSGDARKATPAQDWARALETIGLATRDPDRILTRAIADWASRYGDAPALLSDREAFSFRALEGRMNQYSRWALNARVAPGETIALMMGNRPEYFTIWLGLIQVGAIVALLSPSLRGSPLVHALTVARARRVIVAAENAAPCMEAIAGQEGVEVWIHGAGGSDVRRVDLAVSTQSGDPVDPARLPRITLADSALRIFTSGTTGLPKAAEVSHRKLILWTHWFAGLAGFTAEDRHYNCLPMHHSVGGVVAVGAPLVFGGAAVISERFSGRGFWDDVSRWRCTAFQYVGELCRYLVAAPKRSSEQNHGLRIAIGNGLSESVWCSFVERFGPTRILEFYASTEGNVWLYNVEGKMGSIGRVPAYLAARRPLALARFDFESQTPARGRDGLCEPCTDGEVGEALGRISDDPGSRFEGYSEEKETDRKILRDVFKAGDAWMRTGDLMRRDSQGFFTFVDRIGDTFRWKGENVSALEVASVLASCFGVVEAIVYGVAITGADGRAGMALLKTDPRFDLDALVRRLDGLPRYAWPLFLRLASEIERTETFKPKRSAYVAQGFDPGVIDDPLYVFIPERRRYAPLNADLYAAIQAGAMRL